ncbi:hypothetical protein F5883DRAFT_617483 [Diaporthe sp. PMI_573]|nr:hypothetical protein F5883DRAFT_617483 [Diaporthaceae sp. PMI_573]
MTSDRVAYDVLQMTMARQRVTVYDLYGLLGVSPNVDEDGLRAAYDSITEKHQQVPSDVINAAYSVLTNPFKRAQYDRDRLEYLYKQYSNHEAFPPTTSVPSANIKGRDDQIQVYTATLVERVKDPISEKKRAINRRIETIRNELDEFNEKSGRQRQDWATSNNRVLRMAGNALCEVVVCAEEDLRMLEDELGRIDGKLSPRDPEGPAGRVTSSGYYGSEIMAMPTGTMTNTMAVPDSQPRVLKSRETPRIPRSPTVRFLPQSASKVGVDGTAEYTPSSEGSLEARNAHSARRVNEFLLDRTNARVQTRCWPNVNSLIVTNAAQASTQPMHDRAASLLEKLRQSAGLDRVGADNDNSHKPSSNGGGAMGLVAWQRLNGPDTPRQQQSPEAMTKRSNSHPTDLTAYTKPYDPTHTHSADQPQPNIRPAQQQQQHGQQLGVPGPPPMAWRNSWDPAYGRSQFDGSAGGGYGFYGGHGGLNVARPATRGVSATASNTVLFKEVQDRAAALARSHGRWHVGGAGLTNYGGGRAVSARKEKRAEDPFA